MGNVIVLSKNQSDCPVLVRSVIAARLYPEMPEAVPESLAEQISTALFLSGRLFSERLAAAGRKATLRISSEQRKSN